MGQKIHPYGLRLGIVTDWKSRWYSEKDYAFQANQDHQIRKLLKGELKRGAVSRIDVERVGNNKVQVDVHTGRPGVVIGRGGSEAERLRSAIERLTGKIVKFNVIEVQNPELDATLLARSVADQLEGRVSFRRAMKRAVSTALKAGAEGVRVQAAGRLGGSDMGRREWYLEGRVPLHTLRADIDYGKARAATTVGAIGVQVWVYKGDILPTAARGIDKIEAEARLASGGTSERRRSAKSRAEAAAGGTSRRLIEAGGGKRIVEAGGGKRREGGGRRLIEAGGGRKPTAEDAQGEFEKARSEAEDTIDPMGAAAAASAEAATTPSPDAAATTEAAAPAETEAAVETEPAADTAPEADTSEPGGATPAAAPEVQDVTETAPPTETESVTEAEAATAADATNDAPLETEAAAEVEADTAGEDSIEGGAERSGEEPEETA